MVIASENVSDPRLPKEFRDSCKRVEDLCDSVDTPGYAAQTKEFRVERGDTGRSEGVIDMREECRAAVKAPKVLKQRQEILDAGEDDTVPFMCV